MALLNRRSRVCLFLNFCFTPSVHFIFMKSPVIVCIPLFAKCVCHNAGRFATERHTRHTPLAAASDTGGNVEKINSSKSDGRSEAVVFVWVFRTLRRSAGDELLSAGFGERRGTSRAGAGGEIVCSGTGSGVNNSTVSSSGADSSAAGCSTASAGSIGVGRMGFSRTGRCCVTSKLLSARSPPRDGDTDEGKLVRRNAASVRSRRPRRFRTVGEIVTLTFDVD